MAPTRRNGVPFVSTSLNSGDRRAGKRAHSAPGRDATPGLDVDMSDNEFTETVNLGTKRRTNDDPKTEQLRERWQYKGNKKESDDDLDDNLGPQPRLPVRAPIIIRAGEGSPQPEQAPRRYPKTPQLRWTRQPTHPTTPPEPGHKQPKIVGKERLPQTKGLKVPESTQVYVVNPK